MVTEKLIYCIKLYNYLRDHPNKRFTVKALASKFDINERTARRYLIHLLEVDFNILTYQGRNGGYVYADKNYER